MEQKYIRTRKDGKFRVHFERNHHRFEKDFKTLDQAIQWRNDTLVSIAENPDKFRKTPSFNIYEEQARERYVIDNVVMGVRNRFVFHYNGKYETKQNALIQAQQKRTELLSAWRG